MEPYDEQQIDATDTIIRRIDPVNHVVHDENRGCNRISSKAFKPSSGPKAGMSVDIENLMIDADINPMEYVTNPRFIGSVSFIANVARDLGLRVGYDPIDGAGEEIGNPYHGEVWGAEPRPNYFTRGQTRNLHLQVRWYVEIPSVEIR